MKLSQQRALAGRYPRHLGIERNVEPGEPGLLSHETSLPRYFRDAGFRTALYGKWHLGHGADDSQSGERTLHWRIDLPGEGEDWLPRRQRALRRGNWKYLWDGTFDFLFDLSADPGERNDLGYRHPELIAELRGLAKGDW